jgi:hypothetical protein
MGSDDRKLIPKSENCTFQPSLNHDDDESIPQRSYLSCRSLNDCTFTLSGSIQVSVCTFFFVDFLSNVENLEFQASMRGQYQFNSNHKIANILEYAVMRTNLYYVANEIWKLGIDSDLFLVVFQSLRIAFLLRCGRRSLHL